MRFVAYHRMATMSSREFDVNGRRWETNVLCWSHESQRTWTTPCQCGLLYDGGAFTAKFSWAKEAVGNKRGVRKLPAPFGLVTATTPQSSESGLWLEFCFEKKAAKTCRHAGCSPRSE